MNKSTKTEIDLLRESNNNLWGEVKKLNETIHSLRKELGEIKAESLD